MTPPVRPAEQLLIYRLAAVEQRLAALERMPSGRNSLGIGQLRPAVKLGTPSDSDYATAPPVGSHVYDDTAHKWWVRGAAGVWRSVTLT